MRIVERPRRGMVRAALDAMAPRIKEAMASAMKRAMEPTVFEVYRPTTGGVTYLFTPGIMDEKERRAMGMAWMALVAAGEPRHGQKFHLVDGRLVPAEIE